MSDIDFDELDKAVNSLADDDSDKKNEQVENMPKQKPSGESSSKHSGRFMDLIHSSSDMKKEGSTMMNASTTNIAPINGNVKAEPINPESSDDNENLTNNSSTQLDSDKDTTKDESKKTDEKTTPSSDEKAKDKKTAPFLDNAKVKKRPLGGTNPDPSISPDPKKGDNSEAPTQTPAEPVILPPELDKNLVTIESGEAPEAPQVSAEPPAVTEEATTPQKPATIEKDKKLPAKDPKEEVAQLLASASSGSIPDQYKRENRSHELHTPHPLFNFEHYGSSSSKVAKKPKSKASSIFQWIFIIIGLLLLGGSIGAAIFVFVSKI